MKFLVLATLVAVCSAQNLLYTSPLYGGWAGYGYSGIPFLRSAALPYAAAPVVSAPVVAAAPVALASKYHAQDALGQASFGHVEPFQSRAEVRDLSGNVRGSYSYVDPNGKVNVVEYTAGHAGFRVLGNNLPEAPAVPVAPELKAPEPVQDTAEVVAAKAEFARKFEEAKSRQRRQVFLSAPFAPIAAPIVPTLAKSSIKYSQFEAVPAAVPASTQKLELKEKEQEILTPVTYTASYVPQVKVIAAEKPIEIKTIATPYAYNYGLNYPYLW